MGRDRFDMHEIIDPETGEVIHVEPTVNAIPPEPDDLTDPVPFPELSVEDLDPPDDNQSAVLPSKDCKVYPDPDASEPTITRLYGDQEEPSPEAPPEYESDFVPPTDEEIRYAARTGISAKMERLWHIWKDCDGCALAKTRKQVVLGSGNPAPSYVFIGQAPGPNEDQFGGPFVGPAGHQLTAVLNTVEINRVTECYLMNTVCCRPINPVNGNVCPPTLDEIAACRSRLSQQMRLLLSEGTVKVIVLLGKEAYVDFFYKSQVESGQFNMGTFRVSPQLGWQDLSEHKLPDNFPEVYFTYHPSYILRRKGESAPEYAQWRQDFEAIKRYAADGIKIKPRGEPVKP